MRTAARLRGARPRSNPSPARTDPLSAAFRSRADRLGPDPRNRWTALTGTPGSGKSWTGRLLARTWNVVEVADLADRLGCTSGRSARSRRVDLDCLARNLRGWGAATPGPLRSRKGLLVGHLAHLLPVPDVVVLRCHPSELDRRLRRRGTRARERRANVASEAIGLILFEAASQRGQGRLWEVDTTGRSPATVARAVGRLLQNRPASRFGQVDWLADSSVTEQLLRDSP